MRNAVAWSMPWFPRAVTLIVMTFLALGCAGTADDPYRTIEQEGRIRAPIVRAVFQGVYRLSSLPQGTPDELARAVASLGHLNQLVERGSADLAESTAEAMKGIQVEQARLARLKAAFVLHGPIGLPTVAAFGAVVGDGGASDPSAAANGCGADCRGGCRECAQDELCFGGQCRCIPAEDGRGCGEDVPTPSEVWASWIETLSAAIQAADAILRQEDEVLREYAELLKELPGLEQRYAAAWDEAADIDRRFREARPRSHAARVTLKELERTAQSTEAKIETLERELVKKRADLERLRGAYAGSAARMTSTRARKARLERERSQDIELARRLAEAGSRLASVQAEAVRVREANTKRQQDLVASYVDRIDAAKATINRLAAPLNPPGRLPLGGSPESAVPGDDPRAPESVSYLRSGALLPSDVLEARFARYVESMQQALDRRRAAWATVSPARYRSFPDWPAQDRAIEVHLYDLRGLAAANLRLRQAWGQL
jgi:hypothetical protein